MSCKCVFSLEQPRTCSHSIRVVLNGNLYSSRFLIEKVASMAVMGTMSWIDHRDEHKVCRSISHDAPILLFHIDHGDVCPLFMVMSGALEQSSVHPFRSAHARTC